jgi:subtilisin family serine protease
MKKTVLALVLLLAMPIAMLPVTSATEFEIRGELTLSSDLGYNVSPVQYSPACWGELCDPEEIGDMPYNLDMIDAEKVCQDGEDIYVAVLDTGLMYNWMDYLPVENIRADLGKGYSYHTCYWNETAQDFYLDDFWDTRGFITELGQPWESYYYPVGDGHGTHVTSIITGFKYVSAYWGQEFWVRGVAPKVQLIPVLVLDTWIGYVPPGQSIPEGYYIVGGGSYEMVASGINYIADLAETFDIKIVINLSLGGPSTSDLVEDAIDNAIEKGCIVVAAAGNAGYEQMDYPGAYSPVISVASGGWTMENIGSGSSPHEPPYRWWLSDVPECFYIPDENNNTFQLFVNDFSGRPNPELGQSRCDLDVCGPGSWVVGPYSPYGCLIDGGDWFDYYYVGGTSQATPHVSGIAALVLQKYRDFNQCQMQIVLKTAGLSNRMTKWFQDGSATVYAFQGPPTYDYDYEEFTWTKWDYGTGFLQADAALKTALIYNWIFHRVKHAHTFFTH